MPDLRYRGDAPARRDEVPGHDGLAQVRAVLCAAGVPARGVRRAGAAGDVLAVDADARELDRVRAVAPDLRRIGFCFVALEIISDGADARSHVRPGPG